MPLVRPAFSIALSGLALLAGCTTTGDIESAADAPAPGE